MGRQSSYNEYMSYYTATSEALAVDGQRPRRSLAPRGQERPGRAARQERGLRKDTRKGAGQDARSVRRSKLSADGKRSKRLKTPKKRRDFIIIRDTEILNVRFFTLPLLITLFAIFFGMVATASSSAVLRKSQTELNAMRHELVAMQDEEAVLRAKISEEYDMTKIERIATMRLNMSKPRAHQIRYISLPKQDYVIHHGIAEYDGNPEGLADIIGGLLNSAKATLFSIFPG